MLGMQTTQRYSGFSGEVQSPEDVCRMLSPDASRHFNAMANSSSYPANITLFRENESLRNVYLIIEGEVKLSMNASDGRCLDIRIARKGEILGLGSSLSGNPHAMTAKTLCPSRLAPIGLRDFLGFLARYPSARQALSEVISPELTVPFGQSRTTGLLPGPENCAFA